MTDPETNDSHYDINYLNQVRSKIKQDNPSDFTDADSDQEYREPYIKYPTPAWIYILLVLLFAAMAAAIIKSPSVITDFKIYKTAEASYDQKYYNAAANSYLSVSRNYKDGLRINERMFLALVKANRFNEASAVFNERLAGKDASDETYEEIDTYINLLDKFYATTEKINEISNDETMKKDFAKMYAEIESLKTGNQYDYSIILYYLSQINFMQNKSDLAVEQLKEASSAEPRYTFIAAQLGSALRRLRQYDAAAESYNNILLISRDNEEAFRGLGIIDLLTNKKEKGLELSKKAYDINKYGNFVADTYVAALYANGKKKEAQTVYEDIKKVTGYEVDPQLEAYLAGKATLENMYIN